MIDYKFEAKRENREEKYFRKDWGEAGNSFEGIFLMQQITN
jgi:hypothetical protein